MSHIHQIIEGVGSIIIMTAVIVGGFMLVCDVLRKPK